VTHGFFAKDLLPDLALPTESNEEFQDFHDLLREEYQPVGSLEDLEVERIAICRWRLRRAWFYENAEISRAVVDTVRGMRGDVEEDTRAVNAKALSLLDLAEEEIKTCGGDFPEIEGAII
jgi:hypothetical protein